MPRWGGAGGDSVSVLGRDGEGADFIQHLLQVSAATLFLQALSLFFQACSRVTSGSGRGHDASQLHTAPRLSQSTSRPVVAAHPPTALRLQRGEPVSWEPGSSEECAGPPGLQGRQGSATHTPASSLKTEVVLSLSFLLSVALGAAWAAGAEVVPACPLALAASRRRGRRRVLPSESYRGPSSSTSILQGQVKCAQETPGKRHPAPPGPSAAAPHRAAMLRRGCVLGRGRGGSSVTAAPADWPWGGSRWARDTPQWGLGQCLGAPFSQRSSLPLGPGHSCPETQTRTPESPMGRLPAASGAPGEQLAMSMCSRSSAPPTGCCPPTPAAAACGGPPRWRSAACPWSSPPGWVWPHSRCAGTAGRTPPATSCGSACPR